MDLEQSEIERKENTNLRILEWIHSLEADEKEGQTIMQVDMSAAKHVKAGNRCLAGGRLTSRWTYHLTT